MNATGTKQAENIVKTWNDTQTKIWDGLLEAMQGAAGGLKATQGWEQVYKNTLESCQESVNKALEAQTQWIRIWSEGLTSRGAPAEVAEGIRVMQQTAKTWIDAQGQVWASWFEIARKLDPSRVVGGWDKVLDAWQQAVRKAAEAQSQWFTSQATVAVREADAATSRDPGKATVAVREADAATSRDAGTKPTKL